MPRPAVPTLLVVALLGACAAPSPPPAATLDAARGEAIRDSVAAMLASWRTAIGALDGDRVAAHYLADTTFRWIEDGVVRYRHRLEVANAIRETAAQVRRTELLLDGTIITPLAPGVAAVVTGFAQKVEDSAGRVGGFAGAITAVVVHTPDGWVFRLGHTSSGGAPRPTNPEQ